MFNRAIAFAQRVRLALLALAAVGMLALGAYHAWNTVQLIVDGTHVTGRVEDSLRSTADGETSHRAIIVYSVDGEERRIMASRETDTAPRTGEARELLVAPDDPTDARPDEFGELWISTIALLVFGVLLAAAVAYVKWGRAWLQARR